MKINGAMLTVARMSRGKSIKELALSVGCQPKTISYAEIRETINDELLTKISKILDYPQPFFLRQDGICHMYGQRGQKAIRRLFKCMFNYHISEKQLNRQLSDRQKQVQEKFINELKMKEII